MRTSRLKCKQCKNIIRIEVEDDRDTFVCGHCGVDFTLELKYEYTAMFGIQLIPVLLIVAFSEWYVVAASLSGLTAALLFAVYWFWRPYTMEIKPDDGSER